MTPAHCYSTPHSASRWHLHTITIHHILLLGNTCTPLQYTTPHCSTSQNQNSSITMVKGGWGLLTMYKTLSSYKTPNSKPQKVDSCTWFEDHHCIQNCVLVFFFLWLKRKRKYLGIYGKQVTCLLGDFHPVNQYGYIRVTVSWGREERRKKKVS